MTAATTSNWQFYLGTAASPQVLTAIEEVFAISEVGQTNNLIDATNFDSPAGTIEYIAGLADGSEITVEANYLPAGAQQEVARIAVDSQDTRLCRVNYTGTSPNKTWSFSAVCIGFTEGPSVDDRNTVQFTYKISGGITRA